MSNATQAVLITTSSLSLLMSAATLAVVLIGARKAQGQIEEVKTKTNKAVTSVKNALEHLEL